MIRGRFVDESIPAAVQRHEARFRPVPDQMGEANHGAIVLAMYRNGCPDCRVTVELTECGASVARKTNAVPTIGWRRHRPHPGMRREMRFAHPGIPREPTCRQDDTEAGADKLHRSLAHHRHAANAALHRVQRLDRARQPIVDPEVDCAAQKAGSERITQDQPGAALVAAQPVNHVAHNES
ncbi:hypothetical protein D3C72_1801990 [compost metagenome]